MQMQLTAYMDKTDITARIMAGLMKLVDEDRALDILETLDDWKIMSNSRAKTRSGLCSYKRKEIQLHVALLKEGREDDCNQTAVHEIAHAVADLIHGIRNIKGHGREWQAIMKAFGHPADRCSNHDYISAEYNSAYEKRMKKAKYMYACNRCEEEMPAIRKKKYDPDRYSHIGCGGKLYLKSQRR